NSIDDLTRSIVRQWQFSKTTLKVLGNQISHNPNWPRHDLPSSVPLSPLWPPHLLDPRPGRHARTPPGRRRRLGARDTTRALSDVKPSSPAVVPSIGFMDISDDEKEVGGGTTTRGADWQVVTLTASAYEAAPGPAGTEGKPINREHSSSDALLISDHFVFPPSEHENLPIQTSFDEIQPEKDVQKASTSEEDYSIKNDVSSERVQFYDEGKNLSADDVEMRDEAAVYGSSHAEDDVHDFAAHDDGNEAGEDFDEKSDQPLKPSADSESCDTGASCKCWLKKHMTCMYHQAKEANVIWSVVVAAALVGIVILGHWHKDKLRIDQLRWRSGSAVRG
ncbi:hypothetical protein U9M48_030901, partial [Paspalum notatum var. saurae]